MSQTYYYPASSVSNICKACYVSGESSSCRSSSGSSQNSSTGCGNCNTSCNSVQNYCSIGHQLISSHGDVGSFSGFGVETNDIIFEKWTHTKWNQLQDKYKTAGEVGSVSQGAPSFTSVNSNDVITADLYNEFYSAAQKFNASSYITKVEKDQVITAAHSSALENSFSHSTFNTSVCDICNARKQHNCSYNCSCNYNCCNYNCSCNKPEEKTTTN